MTVEGHFLVLDLLDFFSPAIEEPKGKIIVLDSRAVVVGKDHGYFYDPRKRDGEFPVITDVLQEWLDDPRNDAWPSRAELLTKKYGR